MGSLLSKQLTEEEMTQVQELVEKIISENKVVVFSKSYCRKYTVKVIMEMEIDVSCLLRI
jgi:septin family protein